MNGEYISIETLRIIQSLEKENKKLNEELEIEKDISDGMLETINKAIEYVEKENVERFENPTIEMALSIRKDKLLKILRGDENGNNK